MSATAATAVFFPHLTDVDGNHAHDLIMGRADHHEIALTGAAIDSVRLPGNAVYGVLDIGPRRNGRLVKSIVRLGVIDRIFTEGPKTVVVVRVPPENVEQAVAQLTHLLAVTATVRS